MGLFFKDETRHQLEWDQLGSKNNALREIIIDVAKWIQKTYGKDTVITHIYRRQSEQDAFYKGKKNSKGVEYDKHPWKSDHQFWNSTDLRSKNLYTDEEIKGIENYVNTKYNAKNKLAWTCKCHKVDGQEWHFHFQFISKV